MNRTVAAGAALVAVFAIASPMRAWSATDAGSPPVQPAPAQQATGPAGGDGEGWRNGPLGEHRGWAHRMMMHRLMMQLSPRQRCEERLARRAGMIAYTVEKLNLAAQQKPLWDKLNSSLQAAADKERQLCQSLKGTGKGGQDTILDRVSRREQFLTARLQGLQQVRPALQQFYQALTADQKAIVDHPFRPR